MNIEKVLFVNHFKSKKDQNQRFIGIVYTIRGILTNQDIADADAHFINLIHGDKIGPFESKEDLVAFAHTLSGRYKLNGICLCDEEIVNKAFLEVRHVSKLNAYLFEIGEVIDNPTPKKKGLFSSIIGD